MKTTRKEFLAGAALLGVPALMSMSPKRRRALKRSRADNAPANGRPNILFVLTDDQPAHTLYGMPRTLEAFSGGLDLTATGYSDVPLCAPARASLLRGVYPHTNGITENEGAYARYRERGYEEDDLLSRLNRAGYRTGWFGKIINGYGVEGTDGESWVHPGADRWVGLVGGQGADPYRVNINGAVRERTEDHTSAFGRPAEAFIRQGETSGAAWFCYLNWTDPHTPYTPPRADADLRDGARYSSPGTEEADLSDKTPYWSTATRLGYTTPRISYEGTLEELAATDRWMGRLMTALRETGQLENTIVIYTSDNGFMLGEHGGMRSKGHPYEESARVPFLIRGPGIPAAAENPLVTRLDLTRTILDAADADLSGLDGRDLRGLGRDPWRKRVLVEHPIGRWAMVREGDLVLIRFDAYGEEEFYDLGVDPYQLENVAARRPEEVAAMRAHLGALRSSTGGALRAAEEVA